MNLFDYEILNEDEIMRVIDKSELSNEIEVIAKEITGRKYFYYKKK